MWLSFDNAFIPRLAFGLCSKHFFWAENSNFLIWSALRIRLLFDCLCSIVHLPTFSECSSFPSVPGMYIIFLHSLLWHHRLFQLVFKANLKVNRDHSNEAVCWQILAKALNLLTGKVGMHQCWCEHHTQHLWPLFDPRWSIQLLSVGRSQYWPVCC